MKENPYVDTFGNSDVVVEYDGFEPSEALRRAAMDAFRQIYEESPYGASILVSLAKEGALFRCQVQINSVAGPFFAVAVDASPLGAVGFSKDRIHRKLLAWKSRRFSGQAFIQRRTATITMNTANAF